MRQLVALCTALGACAGARQAPVQDDQGRPSLGSAEAAPAASVKPAPREPSAAPVAEPQLEPDGNDEQPAPAVALPSHGRFAKVGRHWAALQRICDFAVLDGALTMVHATRPLGLGGASITRYEPGARPAFSLLFNWNREGEPERGGGAGQGFLRVRSIDGRLYVPDADPPYLGLGLVSGVEGYLFASDAKGRFRRTRMPRHLPPAAPVRERAGAFVLPGALHGFDVIVFRGKLYASTSAAIPPNGSARSSPGTLFSPDESGAWRPAYTYAGAGEVNTRLGYMTRFRDRLYVALSPLEDQEPHDFLVIAPPRGAKQFTSDDVTPRQVTRSGRAHTLRWYTDRGRLYWIAVSGDGVELRVSDDGERFQLLELPGDAARRAMCCAWAPSFWSSPNGGFMW